MPGASGDLLGRIRACKVLGATGFPDIGKRCDLVFTRSSVQLVSRGHPTVSVALDSIVALDVSGAGGASGSRFFGGGFGLQGAVTGMAVAGALNALGNDARVYSDIRVRTTESAEIVVRFGGMDAAQVRAALTPVFEALRKRPNFRDAESLRPSEGAPGAIERLGELARLLDRGLITEEEFQTLKAEAMPS